MEVATLTQNPSSSTSHLNKWDVFDVFDYDPHPGQVRLHSSDARFRVIVAGRRWGKSLSAAKEAEVMLLTPGTRGWVVSKTYDLTMKVIREINDDMVKKKGLRPSKKQMSGPIVLEFPWGSSVEGKSAEHPDSLLGEGLDWLIFDECAKCNQTVWEQYLRPTLTDREGWCLFITTPQGYNWVYDLWKRGNDDDYGSWESFKSPSWDNPHLNKDDIEEARRTLEHATFQQEYGADFTLAAGQVYQAFDESIHVLKAREIKAMVQDGWSRYRAQDYGYDNPTVVLWITVDPMDRVIIYDEFYRNHMTEPNIANSLVRMGKIRNQDAETHRSGKVYEAGYKNKFVPLCDDKNTRYEWTVSDVSGKAQRMLYAELGIPAFGYKQDLMEGLNKVRECLKIRSDGTPGLYISDKCVHTIKEFNLYSYPAISATNIPRTDEKPAKQWDHSMDALRYFVYAWKRGIPESYTPKRS